MPPELNKRSAWLERVLLALFVLSGAAGLMHEVAWTRLLRVVMGNTTHSIATVLCVFMAGLALGSWLGGRIVDRHRNSLLLFALLEGVCGVYCLLLPLLIHSTEPLFPWAYAATYGSPAAMLLVRFTLCAALLIVPATSMGATLPVLTYWFTQSGGRVGRSAGLLYALNTLGAVAGAATAGLWLLPAIGVWQTICVGAAINFLISISTLIFHQVFKPAVVENPQPSPTPAAVGIGTAPLRGIPGRVTVALLLIGYGLSGMAAMVYEIAWTRVLTLLIGSSVYAFSLILIAFIFGLALGSLIYARAADRVRWPLRNLAMFQFGIGISSLLVVPLLGMLPLLVTGMISWLGRSFWVLQVAEFALALSVMLVPTVLMGATFPLVIRVFAGWSSGVGRCVGTVYGVNALGTIFGSFLGGFVLIPFLGIQHTLCSAVAVSLLIGCAYLLLSAYRTTGVRWALATMILLASAVGVWIIPPWDAATMSFGPFIQAVWLNEQEARSRAAIEKLIAAEETIFYREGLTSTVTVRRDSEGVLSLLTNGRIEATSRGGESQQRLLAHIPLLLHPGPRDVLTIGLASGITLDAAARHPVRTLDCVELSEDVIEATKLFAEANHNVLEDSRLRLIIADGRNHLARTQRRYDVIISQPSDPASAGVADLFTREFFQACYNKLNDRGMVCVWLKATSVDTDVFRAVAKTFTETFDDVTIWSATGYTEFLLVGSRGKMSIDHRLLAQRIATPGMAEEMAMLRIESVPDLLGNLVAGRQGTRHFVGAAGLHTDDNALLEFSAPRTEFTRKDPRPLVEALLAARDTDISLLTDDGKAAGKGPSLADVKASSNRNIQARTLVYAIAAAFEQQQFDQAMDMLVRAAALNPREPAIVAAVARLRKKAADLMIEGRTDEAAALNRQIARIAPAGPNLP